MSSKATYGIGCLAAAGLAAAALALASAQALAQSAQSNGLTPSNGAAQSGGAPQANDATQDSSPPSLHSLKLTCKDFKHNSDGSWVALHRVTVGDASLQPGAPLGLGTVVGKVRLAGILDSECLSH